VRFVVAQATGIVCSVLQQVVKFHPFGNASADALLPQHPTDCGPAAAGAGMHCAAHSHPVLGPLQHVFIGRVPAVVSGVKESQLDRSWHL
jgi:hypothetical protein